MAKRGISVPVISEEDSEPVKHVVKINGVMTNGEPRDKNPKAISRSVTEPSISINGTKYDEISEMAAMTIQGAFKRMRQKKTESESEGDATKPDVINM